MELWGRSSLHGNRSSHLRARSALTAPTHQIVWGPTLLPVAASVERPGYLLRWVALAIQELWCGTPSLTFAMNSHQADRALAPPALPARRVQNCRTGSDEPGSPHRGNSAPASPTQRADPWVSSSREQHGTGCEIASQGQCGPGSRPNWPNGQLSCGCLRLCRESQVRMCHLMQAAVCQALQGVTRALHDRELDRIPWKSSRSRGGNVKVTHPACCFVA